MSEYELAKKLEEAYYSSTIGEAETWHNVARVARQFIVDERLAKMTSRRMIDLQNDISNSWNAPMRDSLPTIEEAMRNASDYAPGEFVPYQPEPVGIFSQMKRLTWTETIAIWSLCFIITGLMFYIAMYLLGFFR